MNRGVLYVMSTAIPDIVKIGKAGIDRWKARTDDLSKTGYRNMNNLQLEYAIAVEDYHNKEQLLHQVFSAQRVGNTELFAVNHRLVVNLMKALAGDQLYSRVHTVPTNDCSFECHLETNHAYEHFAHAWSKEKETELDTLLGTML